MEINNLSLKNSKFGQIIILYILLLELKIPENKIINPCNYVYTTHLQGLILFVFAYTYI